MMKSAQILVRSPKEAAVSLSVTPSPAAQLAWKFAQDLLRHGAEQGVRSRAVEHLRWMATTATGICPEARAVYAELVELEDAAASLDWDEEA